MHLTHALKWSFLSEITSKAAQPIVFVILARLLTPEDYGVVAAATMVISFSQIFWEAGMAKAIIQYDGERSTAANVAFWINNALSILIAGILIACADLIANKIFHDPRVALVLQVMSIQILLTASISVHTALLQKDMQFKRLFWVRLTTTTIPGFTAIPLAYYGMGYWSLVAGNLIGQTLQVIIIWQTTTWKPHFSFDLPIAKLLARFGGWVTTGGLLGWFYLWADSMLVGLHMHSVQLGLYHTGSAIVQMLYGLFFGPLLPVLFSYLSKYPEKRNYLREYLFLIQKSLFLVSLPIGIGMFIFGDKIYLILGNQWSGAGSVIAILGLMHGLSWLMGANDEAYKSIGRPDVFVKIMTIGIFYYLPSYYFGSKYGLQTFLWIRFSLFIISQPLHFYFLRKVIGINFIDVLKNIYFPTTLIAVTYTITYYIIKDFIIIESDHFHTLAEILLYLFLVIILTLHQIRIIFKDLTEIRLRN